MTGPDVQRLGELYLATLVELDEMGFAHVPRAWNKLVQRQQWFQLALRETEEGRALITALVDHERVQVRVWSATSALAWAPDVAVPALRELMSAPSRVSVSSEYVLLAFEEGTLDDSWTPKGPPPRELR